MFTSHAINFSRFSSLLLAATIGMVSAGCHAASGGGIASGARHASNDKDNLLEAVFVKPTADAQAPSLLHDAACVRIQRGVDREVADTRISELRDKQNFGLDPSSRIGAAEVAEHRTLLSFDLSGIPRGSKVLMATISLARRTGGRANMSVHRITDSWTEHGTSWSSFGDAYDSNAAATLRLTDGSKKGRVSIEVTNLVRDWVSGEYPNQGVMVQDLEGDSTFAMSESYDVADHPRLEVCYVGPDFASNDSVRVTSR